MLCEAVCTCEQRNRGFLKLRLLAALARCHPFTKTFDAAILGTAHAAIRVIVLRQVHNGMVQNKIANVFEWCRNIAGHGYTSGLFGAVMDDMTANATVHRLVRP